MGTEPRRVVGAALLVLATTGVSAGSAQEPLYRVNDETTVSSLRFEIRNGSPLTYLGLRNRIASRGPGPLSGVRSFFSWLPLVSEEAPQYFDPISLQKDVVRLERLYRSNGFPQARVDYRLGMDAEKNSVQVVIEIEPGSPRTLDGVTVTVAPGRDTAGLELPELERSLRPRTGIRLGESEQQEVEEEVLTWATRRGYPFPSVESDVVSGADSLTATLSIQLDPGPRATIGEIRILGAQRLRPETVRDQTLVRPGEWYSSHRLHESARLLLEADLIQVALIDPIPGEPTDSLVDLSLRIVEGSPRLVHGALGYADAEGLLTEVGWEHRDVLGDARTLALRLRAETGLLALDRVPFRHVGWSLSLKEPSFLDPRTSSITHLLFDHEDGPREVSRSLGADFTLVHQRGAQRYLSVQYGVQFKDLLKFRGGGLGTLGFLETLRLLEEAAEQTSFQGGLTVSGSWGSSDILLTPSHGWNTRAGVEVVGLDPWSQAQYVRLDGSGSLLRELGETGIRLFARVRGGRILPFGRSGPGRDPLVSYVRFGDALFLEGGTDRVRGWELDLLGPKVPGFAFDTSGDSLEIRAENRYVPLGGTAHWGGSIELQLPLPLLPRENRGLVFLDAGRVWTPDRYLLGEEGFPLLAIDNKAAVGVGSGISFATPIGSVALMLGYKLNPTELDMRPPLEVGKAVLAGAPDLSSVDEDPLRRWRIHLRIGKVF